MASASILGVAVLESRAVFVGMRSTTASSIGLLPWEMETDRIPKAANSLTVVRFALVIPTSLAAISRSACQS